VGRIDLAAIVLLIAGGVAVYIAYRDPRMGAAILVGVGVVGLLYMLLKRDDV
jgi:hypothetical protein